MVKYFLFISFPIFEKKKQTLGIIFKKGSNFEQREREYANTWGWWRPCAWSKVTPEALLLCSSCINNNSFPLRIHFYALLKLQPNCNCTIVLVCGPKQISFYLFDNFKSSKCDKNRRACSPWNVVFIGGNRFAFSMIVFEKYDV